jgi:hypothetical protein
MLTTQQAAVLLGKQRHNLSDLIHANLLQPPPRRLGRFYCWTPADIRRARAVLAVRKGRGRPRKQPLPGKEAGHAAQ